MKDIIKIVETTLQFIQPFMPLIDSHMVTFFTSNLWEKHVPLTLRNEFYKLNIDNIVDIFKSASAGNNTEIKELSQFVQTALHMDVARQISLSLSQVKQILETDKYDVNRPLLPGFMTEKKSHEVEILVELIAALTHRTGATHIVEIGDGKGYTSSFLALQHRIKVLGLESSEKVINGAQKRNIKLQKYFKSRQKENFIDLSQLKFGHRQIMIHVSPKTDLGKHVVQTFPEDWPLYSLGLTGLHTCGDLSPICLRLFTSGDTTLLPRFLINVGCCYNHLNSSRGHSLENPSGFPLSRFIKFKNFHLSRNARMMSLQATDKILQQKISPSRTLLFRAILEQLLDDVFGLGVPIERDVGRIGNKCSTFVEYVHKASAILGCHLPLKDDQLLKYFEKFQKFEKQLHFYFMLRVVLAPVIEGIILVDRLLFLKEKGLEDTHLVKLFDPVISPRCYGIFSIRQDYHTHNLPPPGSSIYSSSLSETLK